MEFLDSVSGDFFENGDFIELGCAGQKSGITARRPWASEPSMVGLFCRPAPLARMGADRDVSWTAFDEKIVGTVERGAGRISSDTSRALLASGRLDVGSVSPTGSSLSP